jgi:hypothetical protein
VLCERAYAETLASVETWKDRSESSAGFHRSVESFAEVVLDIDGSPGEEEVDVCYEVRVCNHCGEFNSETAPWFPRIAKRSEITRCPRCGRESVRVK